jgi:hypothetical protein
MLHALSSRAPLTLRRCTRASRRSEAQGRLVGSASGFSLAELKEEPCYEVASWAKGIHLGRYAAQGPHSSMYIHTHNQTISSTIWRSLLPLLPLPLGRLLLLLHESAQHQCLSGGGVDQPKTIGSQLDATIPATNHDANILHIHNL